MRPYGVATQRLKGEILTMKQYTADKIRNEALAGHSSAGKTSLAEHGVSQKEKNAQKKGKKKPAGFLAGGRFYRKICKCKPHMICRSFLTEKR